MIIRKFTDHSDTNTNSLIALCNELIEILNQYNSNQNIFETAVS